MSLKDALKTAVIEDLKKVRILTLDSYARQNQETLAFLYEHGIIDDSSIEKALEEAIFRQARQDYEIMTRKGKPYIIWAADHVGSPECFAYALERGEFSRREIKRIPFDHGDTVETFPQDYGKENLLSSLREELLNPKPFPKFREGYDLHPI